MTMTKSDKAKAKRREDIRQIVIHHDKDAAVKLMVENGYVKSPEEGRRIVDQMNGVAQS